MTIARLIYCPCPDVVVARDIGRQLVTDGVAACVNIIPGVTSIFRWNDTIDEASEAILIVKTTEKRSMECRYAIAAAHPADCPVIISLQPEHVNDAALQWLGEATATHTERVRRGQA